MALGEGSSSEVPLRPCVGCPALGLACDGKGCIPTGSLPKGPEQRVVCSWLP